jgi:glucosamine--fructose-6-phosphate aminotransferase (isomerizing)
LISYREQHPFVRSKKTIPSFTTQLAVLACFTVALARPRGAIGHDREADLVGVMTEIPSRASEVLNHDERIQEIATEIALARDVLYLGRHSAYPLALEGPLKLKGFPTFTPRAMPPAR